MTKDPYEVLGISRDADTDEIKTAYRKMAKMYHPDLNPGDAAAAERMNEINAAYDILSDESKKAAYDVSGYAGQQGNPFYQDYPSGTSYYGERQTPFGNYNYEERRTPFGTYTYYYKSWGDTAPRSDSSAEKQSVLSIFLRTAFRIARYILMIVILNWLFRGCGFIFFI